MKADVKLNKLAKLQLHTVQITFIFIDFRVCDFAFAFKTQKRTLRFAF